MGMSTGAMTPGGFAGNATPAFAGMHEASFDPVEEARRRMDAEMKRKERAMQMKRGPGVAALVQDALKRARAIPSSAKKADDKPEIGKGHSKVQEVDPESEEEETDEMRKERLEREEIERKLAEEEAEKAKIRAEREAKEREKADKEARARKEELRREAAEQLREAETREAETREQRIKASVEAAKRQQAERAAAKAAQEAADNLYSNMPQPDILAEKQKTEERMAKAVEREKLNNLSNLPPEDRTKVVFLDIDGVLRPARAGGFDVLATEDNSRVDTSDFFKSAVKALRHIIERTGAVIVLSSEWRRSEPLCNALLESFEKNRLRPWGFTTTMDLELEPGPDQVRQFADRRAREIALWVQANEKDLKGWVVLDDINIAIADDVSKKSKTAKKDAIGPRLVQTWPLCGLTMGNAKTAVRILNGEMINKVVVERPIAPAPSGLATPMPGARAGGR